MASLLKDEILANFRGFTNQWPRELEGSRANLQASVKHFEQSYLRITSIQAWRTSITLPMSEDAEAFFFEAQNDFLISHCLASCGSFRTALKALRAAIENVLFFLYYKDHEVELEKWSHGRHRLGFSELHSYFESHPKIIGKKLALEALGTLKDEYSTLSKAVHGSAKAFRMTQTLSEIRLWSDEASSVGKWATREKCVISSLNTLLLHIFRDHLLGSKARGLREVLGITIPKSAHLEIKNEIGVVIISE